MFNDDFAVGDSNSGFIFSVNKTEDLVLEVGSFLQGFAGDFSLTFNVIGNEILPGGIILSFLTLHADHLCGFRNCCCDFNRNECRALHNDIECRSKLSHLW